MFAQPNGKPIDPRRDQYEWKSLLAEAGVREARLHDARHTAATVLLLLGVHERAVMDVMGRIKDDSPGLAMMVYHPAQDAAADRDGPRYTNMYETRNETTNLHHAGPPLRHAPQHPAPSTQHPAPSTGQFAVYLAD